MRASLEVTVSGAVQRPEPGGSANSAGIPVLCDQHRRIGFPAENILLQAVRNILVEPGNLGNSSTEHDDVGIKNVDELGEAAGQTIFVTLDAGHRVRFSGVATRNDIFAVQFHFCGAGIIGFQARSGNPRLDAATEAAVARWAGKFVGAHPGKNGVTPLAGNAISSVVDTAIHGDSAAASGSENHCENQMFSGAGAVGGFGDGEAVGVVGATNFSVQGFAEVAVKRFSNHPGGIGIFYGMGDSRNGTGNADADGAAAAQFAFNLLDALFDGADGGIVIAARGGHPVTMQLSSIAFERDKFNLGSPEVDSDANFASRGMR